MTELWFTVALAVVLFFWWVSSYIADYLEDVYAYFKRRYKQQIRTTLFDQETKEKF